MMMQLDNMDTIVKK